LGGPDSNLSHYESAFRVFSVLPRKRLPFAFKFVQPLSATEQCTPHARNLTFNSIDPQQPLQASCCQACFSVPSSEAAKTGKQLCRVALLQLFLSLRYTINSNTLSYMLPCDGLSALLQDTGHMHTDNSSHAYFIASWHVVW